MNPAQARNLTHDAGLTRRDFLHAGSAAGAGLAVPWARSAFARATAGRNAGRSCIYLFLVGGPGQLDTFDPKPDAPAEIRSPYRAIRTNVPGVRVSEILPLTARQADKFAIVRSMHHDAAAVHETGHQLMQTGRLFQHGIGHPSAGCVLGALQGRRSDLPAHVVLPGPIGNTGGPLPHGQTAGYLGQAHEPLILNSADPSSPNFSLLAALPPEYVQAVRSRSAANARLQPGKPAVRTVSYTPEPAAQAEESVLFEEAARLLGSARAREAFDLSREPEKLRDAYGRNKFGQSCLLARRLIERGVRFVTVNMFERVAGAVTWDCHGSAPFNGLAAYGQSVGPLFDHAYSTLLEDLAARGLLAETLVVAGGEFGRTPRVNPAGGRDHWTGCWSVLFAGGGVQGGQVIGASDERGAWPKDRPTTPAEVVASIYHSMGLDLRSELPGPDGRPVPVVDAGVEPIRELFG